MALTVLDAGVVIALGDTTDVHHRAAKTAVREAREAGARFILPASALAEVLVGPIRAHGLAVARQRVQRMLDALAIEIAQLDTEIAMQAGSLRAEHANRLRLPDALVVATAARNQAGILTTDAGWPALAGVHVIVVGRRGRRSRVSGGAH